MIRLLRRRRTSRLKLFHSPLNPFFSFLLSFFARMSFRLFGKTTRCGGWAGAWESTQIHSSFSCTNFFTHPTLSSVCFSFSEPKSKYSIKVFRQSAKSSPNGSRVPLPSFALKSLSFSRQRPISPEAAIRGISSARKCAACTTRWAHSSLNWVR